MAIADQVLVGSYDYRLVALSVVIAIVAAYAALDFAARVTSARGTVRFLWLTGGAVAMRLPAMCYWSVPLVALSVVLAVGISLVALLLTFYFRGDTSAWSWPKILSAVVMGAAIPVMHYTGMAAATFVASDSLMSHGG